MPLSKSELKELEELAVVIRVLEGKPLEPKDIISKLTNVNNLRERSDFPTYPLLAEQVYCQMVTAKTGLKIFEQYATLKAEALISYKRQSRKENVEMTKGLTQPEQMFLIGDQKQQAIQEKKRRFGFLRRKPKEQSEFVAQ